MIHGHFIIEMTSFGTVYQVGIQKKNGAAGGQVSEVLFNVTVFWNIPLAMQACRPQSTEYSMLEIRSWDPARPSSV